MQALLNDLDIVGLAMLQLLPRPKTPRPLKTGQDVPLGKGKIEITLTFEYEGVAEGVRVDRVYAISNRPGAKKEQPEFRTDLPPRKS